MPVAPPAIIMPAPEIPSNFRLEMLDESAPNANGGFAAGNCHMSNDGSIVVCGKRRLAPRLPIIEPLPPPPLDDVKEPLMFQHGNLEFGAGRKGVGLRLKF